MKTVLRQRLFYSLELLQKLFYPDLKKSEFISDILGFSARNYRAYKNGQNQIPFDLFVICVTKFPQINWNHIMYGEGELLKENHSTLVKPKSEEITISDLQTQVKEIMTRLEQFSNAAE